jgi:phospholipase/lecithinase/hemolysin
LVRHAVSAIMMLSLTGHASAAISRVVAFGDSLSDTGNLFSLTSSTFLGGIPAEPYYNGRFSNGLLAVEAMAFQLGVPVTSYAYGGAQTGPGNEVGSFLKNTGVSSQISKYTTQLYGQAPATDTLFFLWAGPNDFYTGNNMLNPSVPQISSTNMVYDIHALYNAGARNIFVPLMPDLSITPEALGNSAAYRAAALDRTTEFNSLLVDGIANLERTLPGLNVTVFDTPAFMRAELPLLASQGINTTDACYNESRGTVCANADHYVFWDGVHPTTATDWILGSAFVAAATAVPEPGTAWLMLTGGIVVSSMASRRRRKMVAVCARPSSL